MPLTLSGTSPYAPQATITVTYDDSDGLTTGQEGNLYLTTTSGAPYNFLVETRSVGDYLTGFAISLPAGAPSDRDLLLQLLDEDLMQSDSPVFRVSASGGLKSRGRAGRRVHAGRRFGFR